MCHHYRGARQPPEHLADEFSLKSNLYQLSLPEMGFYPLDQVPIVRHRGDGEREMVPAEWGFLPAWWKPSERTPGRRTFQRKTINARAEDVEQKPTYRESFRLRRCLLPAEEFFERGFYFYLESRQPFAFAGLWDRWTDETGARIETCSLLTTAANEAVAAVGHPRMPVVLTSGEEYQRWLDPECSDRAYLEDLLRPTRADIWQVRAAEPAVRPRSQRQDAAPLEEPDGSRQGYLF